MNDAPIRQVIATMPGTNHCSAEPDGHLGEQRREQAEEDQRLDHREDHRHRLAPHGLELAVHHVHGVGREPPRGVSVTVTWGRDWVRVLMLRPRSRSSVASVHRWVVGCGLAQAAAGEVEEDVVERGPRDLDPRRGYAVRGQVGEQLTDQRGAVRDPHGRARRPSTSTRASGARSSRAAARRGVGGRREAEPDQVAEPGLEPGRGVVGDDPAVVDDDTRPARASASSR